MTKMVGIFSVPSGANPKDFYNYWLQTHVPNVKKGLKGLKKYVISRAVGAPEGEAAPFWGMAELWFEDLDSARNALKQWRAAPLDDFDSQVKDLRIAFTAEKEIEL